MTLTGAKIVRIRQSCKLFPIFLPSFKKLSYLCTWTLADGPNGTLACRLLRYGNDDFSGSPPVRFLRVNNWSVRFLFKTSLKLGREIDDSRMIKVDVHADRRGRLSYLLEWAPAKRLRRWISINCPRFSYALGRCHVSEQIGFAFFNIHNYG